MKTHYPTRNATINNMVQTVANYLNVEPSDVFGRCRDRELVVARHVILWFLHTDKQMPQPKIQSITGYNHSTIHYIKESVNFFALQRKEREYTDLIQLLKNNYPNDWEDYNHLLVSGVEKLSATYHRLRNGRYKVGDAANYKTN